MVHERPNLKLGALLSNTPKVQYIIIQNSKKILDKTVEFRCIIPTFGTSRDERSDIDSYKGIVSTTLIKLSQHLWFLFLQSFL